MVDTNVLATMRHAVEAYMLDTVTIGVLSVAKDRYGSEIETFVAVATSKAQLRPPTFAERKMLEPLWDQGRLLGETYSLILPHGTAIANTNVIRTADDRVWKVVMADTVRSLDVQVTVFITAETLRPR
jgi:hypothetical protein